MKQSFSWRCFVRGDADPTRVVRAAACIGYSGAEFVKEAYWSLLHDNGLAVCTISGHESLEDGLNRRENHSRILSEIEITLQKAVENGIPNLVVFSGVRHGADDATGAEVTSDGLRLIAPLAEQAGVTLLLELLNSKVNHPGYQADNTRWGVHVCQDVNSPRVRLLYDIYHMQIMEGNIISSIRENHTWIGHYHTAGVPGRRDLDNNQELYYPAIVSTIAESGYKGYIGHEFKPKGDPIEALDSAFQTCYLFSVNDPSDPSDRNRQQVDNA